MINFTQNLSVKVRLSCFISLLLLLMVGSGYVGLRGMRVTSLSLSDVYQSQVLPLKELREIDNMIRSGLIIPVDRLLFQQNTWDDCLRQVELTRTDLHNKWAMLHKITAPSSDNKYDHWLVPADKLIAETDKVTESLVRLLQQKETTKLDAFTDTQLYPLGEKYREVLDSLVSDRLNAVRGEYQLAQSRYIDSKNLAIVIIGAGIGASLLLSWVLLASITNPLSKITKATQRMMKGDFTKQLHYDRHDEFGTVIEGFNVMVTYLADLIAEVERSGIQVTSSITEIGATIKQQESTVNEQAATSNEIAASSTEIAATSANLMATMENVTLMAKDTANSASIGHRGLSDIDQVMSKMDASTKAIVARLAILSEKANNIAGVTKTINKVADQTNLLSLNAAIEAEKAGEYGSGFSVVAMEIRRLADQTAVATFDIEQIVKEVQAAIAAGVMGIDKFADDVRQSTIEIHRSAEQISEVIDKVQALQAPIETVYEGIAAQSVGAKQISEAIGQLNEAAQQSAESVAQTSDTIFQLNKAALILQDSVARFKFRTGKGNALTSFSD